jgi:Domain of unknown function (DUF4190)/GYF domain 2
MNYTIIGQDGKKYGPAAAEQVRQWVAQGRAESRTPVFVEGAADWTFLGLLPEFAALFSGPPPVITTLKGCGAGVPHTNALAIWGLICGILAWTLCCCLPFNLLGLIFSIIALVQIQSSREVQEGRGFAIAGIILSATNLLWCAVLAMLKFATDNNADMARYLNQN